MVVDTDLLRTFAEVARQGSVTRAARLLRLQQPTVSHRLAALERAVGVPLFERLGNALALTAAGEALLPYARQLPAFAGEAVDAARAAAGLAAQRLHIGCAETPATYLLPGYLRALRQVYPNLQVRLTVGNAARVLTVTISGEVDVALLTEREEHPALHGETFRRDRFVVAVATDDLWAPREVVT
ncbi:MAG: LysR family transcriptional regulator, partial [Chloroflexi bacterium]|nr:LysR family transcriptional regulator [Chloroflexota bacterium]